MHLLLVLDTNVLLWWLFRPAKLSRAAHDAITSPHSHAYVSTASGWEMAIKLALGKLQLRPDLGSWLPGQLAANGFTELPITLRHTLQVEHLPRHHRDPFDRLLISQASVEGLTIVTGDPQFERYPVQVVRS